MASMSWLDYVIFVALLLISLGIGVYHGCTGGRQKTTKEFLLANRKLKVIPTVISLLVSFQSAIMILGFVSEMYMFGITFLFIRIFSASVAMVIIERLFVPWFYPLKLTSVFEYFELRFRSRTVRMVASMLGICHSIFYMAIAMFAPSIAMDNVSGLPLYVTVPIMGVVCVSYTVMGGIRAVIWTDVFQSVVMFGGLLIIIVNGCIKVGGIGKVFQIANEQGRILGIPLDPDPTVRLTLWEGLVGCISFYCASYGISQFSVQRYCATSNLRDARKTVLWLMPVFAFSGCTAAFMGFTVFAYFTFIGCDPVANHEIATKNELLPHFVKQVFVDSNGYCGLLLVILYSGALSSISSCLSGAAANTWEDILKPWLPNITEYRATLINKVVVIIYGTISVALVFVVDRIPGELLQVSSKLLGAIASPLFGMYLLGGLFRKVETKGVVAGGILGFSACSFVILGSMTVAGYHQPLPPTRTDACEPPINVTEATSHISLSGISNLYAISFMWYTPLGTSVTIVTGLIVSYSIRYLFPTDGVGEELPDKLFIQLGGFFYDSVNDCNMEECHNKEPSLTMEKTVTIIQEDAESDMTKEVEITSLMRRNYNFRQTKM